VVAADDPRAGHSGWTPVPDPTALTTEQLRRELSGLREILTARLDGMDRATALLSETVNRTPTVIQTEIAHLRELMETRLTAVEAISTSRLALINGKFSETDTRYGQRFAERDIRFREEFKGIELQFAERDVRTTQASVAADSALKAALQAAKEAVFEQAQAAAKAAEKTELSFTKQIDQIQLQIKTIGDGFGDRLAELKERIDRGEGSTTGSAEFRAARRLDVGQALQAIVTVAALITLLVVLFHR